MYELPKAEQTLLRMLDGLNRYDLEITHATEDIDYLEQLRSCTEYSTKLMRFIGKINYKEVMKYENLALEQRTLGMGTSDTPS